MTMNAGRIPRRLLQTHGAFVNCVLTPRLRMRREYAPPKDMQFKTDGLNDQDTRSVNRWNTCLKYGANDEVFDVREGEILLTSQNESGFANHRRGQVFSSLNNWRGGDTDVQAAIRGSDLKFVGIAQTPYVSSQTALQSQGLVAQCSGVKTILNGSEDTISVGDRLMADIIDRYPTQARKGVPNEKVTMVLKKVPRGYVPDTVIQAVSDVHLANVAGDDDDAREANLKAIIVDTILALRRSGDWVVGKAVSSARKGEQLDVLLTKPSFL